MVTLIVEDDFTSRLILQEMLKSYGPVYIAVNGREAVELVRATVESDEYYDLICLDILMPEMDGQQTLKEIRALEDASRLISPHRAKIVMTTGLGDTDTVSDAIRGQCDHFLVKPIQKAKLLQVLRKLRLVI
jgi:two-component system chemotaxis response regulator CheY